MAQSRAVIHVVRANDRASKLLHSEVVLIHASGGAKYANSIWPILVLDLLEPRCRVCDGLFPRGFSELPVLLDERLCESFVTIDVLIAIASLDAESPLVGHGSVDSSCHHKVVLLILVQGNIAARSAIGADGVGLLKVEDLALADAGFLDKCSNRTSLYASATELAVSPLKRYVERSRYNRLGTSHCHANCLDQRLVLAGVHATPAENALLRVKLDKWIRVPRGFLWVLKCLSVNKKLALLDAELVGKLLQLAISVCIAGHTVQWVMRKCKFEIRLPCVMNDRRVCRNLHAISDLGYTGPLKGPGFLDLDDAHSTSAFLGNAFEVTESGDIISSAFASIQDSHSHRKLIVLPVDLCVDQFFTHHELPPGVLLFENSTETADFIARATFDALIDIDNVSLLDLASDSLDRARTCACSTTNALVRIDAVGKQMFADVCWAFLVLDVRTVFVFKKEDS